MSHLAFVDFYQNYLATPEGTALRGRMQAIDDPDEFCAAVTAAGTASGYEFSEQEVREVVRASKLRMAGSGDDSELSDAQLEHLAGGALSFNLKSVPTLDIRMSKDIGLLGQFSLRI